MNAAPIGFFDSGLGGLCILDAVRKLLPHESRYTASSRFVLPCALAPYMTFVAGEKLTVSKS